MGLKEAVKQLLIRKIEYDYEKLLAGKKISYDTWIREQEAKWTAAGESRRKQQEQAPDFLLLQQKEGTLHDHGLIWIEEWFQDHPEVQILYGGEDLMDESGERKNPWFKPCWSPDLYETQFYVGSVVAVRRSLYEKALSEGQSELIEVQPELIEGVSELAEAQFETSEGVWYFEDPNEIRPLVTACIRLAGGFEKGCEGIGYCPRMLFHVKDEAVWERYLASPEPEDFVNENDISVIIPSKDNPQILENCLCSLKEIPNLEILVVDNGSGEENRRRIELLLGRLETECTDQGWRIRYLYEPMEFNFSRMCNMGAEAAGGRFLLFLNDDIEVRGSHWIREMQRCAERPYTGAVGLKLYYPDSRKIQHAGITNLPVGPVHKLQFAEDDRRYYFDRNRARLNCLAVTGACLMIEKEKYLEVGGFKEALRVAYNDVELGFALYEAGYRNVVLNDCFAYHHESLSRGDDASREKLARLLAEREKLYRLHPALRDQDPYYPEGLSRDGLDSRIAPAYVQGRNTIQEGRLQVLPWEKSQIREDRCVFIGLEQGGGDGSHRTDKCREKCTDTCKETSGLFFKGYGVVLGDNNACYDRYLVLQKAEAGENQQDMLVLKTQPQYRQDLEENMPDQQQVALSGFWIHLSEGERKKLEPGAEYRIGVLAEHKINKGKLLNFSGRYFTA